MEYKYGVSESEKKMLGAPLNEFQGGLQSKYIRNDTSWLASYSFGSGAIQARFLGP